MKLISWKLVTKRFKQSALVFIWLYSVLIFAYIIGRPFIGESIALIEIGNSLTPVILLPALIIVPSALILKRWRLAILSILALIFFIMHYAPMFTPSDSQPPTDTDPIHFLTFNLGSQTVYHPGLGALILSRDADIVAVQELQTGLASDLSAALAEVYPYNALHPATTYARGVGIFSRYPIVDDAYLDGLSLGGQHASIQLQDDVRISIFNVHPTSPRVLGGFDSSQRSDEIDYVLELAQQESGPVLIIGDFNITDLNDDYMHIASRYGDTFRSVGSGLGPTFPNLSQFAAPLGLIPPLLRIDYVFYSNHWTAYDAHVLLNNAGSDHYPLYAELLLKIDVRQ